MPRLEAGAYTVDYTEQGAGPAVVLVHSSGCGNAQWRSLSADLADGYRVLAPNLFGYGATTPWPAHRPQHIDDQVALVRAVADVADGAVHLVGHSFGGVVTMAAALALRERLASLVLLEPNLFYLLGRHGRDGGYAEAVALRQMVRDGAARDDWEAVAGTFVDFWNAPGAWDAMPPDRRRRFLELMKPNLYEWDAIDMGIPIEAWVPLAPRTLLVTAPGSPRCISDSAELLRERLPGLQTARVPEGGHMAPLTRPELVNPIVRAFLDRHATARTREEPA